MGVEFRMSAHLEEVFEAEPDVLEPDFEGGGFFEGWKKEFCDWVMDFEVKV